MRTDVSDEVVGASRAPREEVAAEWEASPRRVVFGAIPRREDVRSRLWTFGRCLPHSRAVEREQRREAAPDVATAGDGTEVVDERQDAQLGERLEHAEIRRRGANPATGQREPDERPAHPLGRLPRVPVVMQVRQLRREHVVELGPLSVGSLQLGSPRRQRRRIDGRRDRRCDQGARPQMVAHELGPRREQIEDHRGDEGELHRRQDARRIRQRAGQPRRELRRQHRDPLRQRVRQPDRRDALDHPLQCEVLQDVAHAGEQEQHDERTSEDSNPRRAQCGDGEEEQQAQAGHVAEDQQIVEAETPSRRIESGLIGRRSAARLPVGDHGVRPLGRSGELESRELPEHR